jgi:hypothetical protein
MKLGSMGDVLSMIPGMNAQMGGLAGFADRKMKGKKS